LRADSLVEKTDSPFRPKAAADAQPADAAAASPFRPKAAQKSPDNEKTPDEKNESPFRPKSPDQPAGGGSDTDETADTPFRKKPSPARTDVADGADESAPEADDNAASDSPFRKKPNDTPLAADKSSKQPAPPSGQPAAASVDLKPGAQPADDDPQLITSKTPLSKGQKLEGQWGSTWEPVTVLEIQGKGMVKVHWDGRPAAYDKSIPRSRLRLPPAESPNR
jgi:hypothetical protein